MSRKSSVKKSCVCCPACGSMLFKGTVAESEHVCPNCKTPLEAWVMNGAVLVYDPTNENFDESTAHRLSTYLESLQKS